MSELNRRAFLIAGAGVGAMGLLGACTTSSFSELNRAGESNRPEDDAGILVIVTLYGGNDGLSTVIPYADHAYHDARPDLAYAPEDVLPLDAELGLNPALVGLSRVWNEKRLAIVRGVTYPRPDRSHFRSMDIWQTASPAEPSSTGWIGRWLDATGDDPLRAINIGSVLPLLAVGEKQAASALTGDAAPVSPQIDTVLASLGSDDPGDTREMSAICSAYRATRDVGAAVGPVLGDGTGNPALSLDPNVGGLSLSGSPSQGRNPLAERLGVAATCIKAGIRTRVYMVALGGFDTHADERDSQQRLLKLVDDAVAPFLRDMATDRYGKNVVVMVYSEFGRRVAANASHGTDHGTAGPVLIAGAPVTGGFYGDEPSLTDLDDGDLKGTTDFRDVYHELLVGVLDTDSEPSVGAGRRALGFL